MIDLKTAKVDQIMNDPAVINGPLNDDAKRAGAIFEDLRDRYRAGPSATVTLITEGRDREYAALTGKKYSWCGDAASYLLELMGVRRGLNRKSVQGKWLPGENIAMIERTYADVSVPFNKAPPFSYAILDRPDGGHACFVVARYADGSYVSADGNGPGGSINYNLRAASDPPLRCFPLTAFLETIPQRAGAPTTRGSGAAGAGALVGNAQTQAATQYFTIRKVGPTERLNAGAVVTTIDPRDPTRRPSAWGRVNQNGAIEYF